jgi:hypothetical protein
MKIIIANANHVLRLSSKNKLKKKTTVPSSRTSRALKLGEYFSKCGTN